MLSFLRRNKPSESERRLSVEELAAAFPDAMRDAPADGGHVDASADAIDLSTDAPGLDASALDATVNDPASIDAASEWLSQSVASPKADASPREKPAPAYDPAAGLVFAPRDVEPAPAGRSGWTERLKGSTFTRTFSTLFARHPKLDDDLLDEIETSLLTADVGVTATTELVGNLRRRMKGREFADANELLRALRADLLAMLKPVAVPLVIDPSAKPFVVLTVGVNGVGKTTTIGKLAKRFKDEGRGLMLAAGDTFRAAAVAQLQAWGERNGVPVVAQGQNADAASVAFDALQAAKARGIDVLIADTAGRLHTQQGLMAELGKIRRVLQKIDVAAPHEVLLVIDGTTGQNAISQLRQFHAAVGVTGLVVTKLDGTAKGGVVFALAREFGIPIRFAGIGERPEDLRVFDADAFVDALLPEALGRRMTDDADGSTATGPRPPRRRRIALLVVLLCLVALAGLVRWASRPQQVAHLVLAQASRALGLHITAGGVSEYQLRGMPKIVLRDVVAQRDGDAAPVLRASRVELSLPWSTLKSRGRDLSIHRIELQQPQLDIAALQRWLATRPKNEQSRLPRLTDGFIVRGGRLIGDGWTVERLGIDVPTFAADRPVRGHLDGRILAGTTAMPFDLAATLQRPADRAGLGIAGHLTVERPDWHMPLDLRAQARPDFASGIAFDRVVLAARAAYQSKTLQLPFALGLAGRATYSGGLHAEPFAIALRKGREIPDLTASGKLAWTRDLDFTLAGDIAKWPAFWPVLPAPLGRPRGPLPLRLAYTGATDLSGTTEMQLRSGRSEFEGRFQLPRLLAWLDGSTRGTPIPPITGRVATPKLEIPGATLEGVDVELDDGSAGR